MNKVAAFALRRKNSILSMSEKMFCPFQPLRFWITPRACGEKWCTDLGDGCDWGSPPRVRGKDKPDEKKFTFGRITPACAGKRARPSPCRSQSRDHPRVCGEKAVFDIISCQSRGSPPRMRGKVLYNGKNATAQGITPAYAGKRDFRGSGPPASRVHPRACGEK